ncbi:MAG: hypothetical protein MJ071_01790 [Oscillospiraceae bacterium]|nr:hypothetical protein [Oscillospiraceae bacterium]
MDFIDYRKALGLSFDDKSKQDLFIKRIGVFMESGEGTPFDEQSEMSLAYMIGERYLLADTSPFNMAIGEDPIGLQRAWLYLSKRTEKFEDFLSCVVALYNTYHGKKLDKETIFGGIKRALDDCHIRFRILKDSDGIFIFPEGAKELDDALVSEPLEWLKSYPIAHKTFVTALQQYSDGIFIRDVADNLRKALEAFLQEFLCNQKNLESNKNEICKYLGEQGVDAGISGLYQPLINTYKNINDRIAKHNDAVDKKLLEFILYQTGLLIRMVISIKTESEEDAD